MSPAAPAAAAAAYRPLGAFRFGLALLVVVQHFQHLLPEADRQFVSRAGLGAVAVCVFFAVSGFVVTEAACTFYRDRPGAFFANRLLRIVPPYLAALAVSAAIQAALWHAGRLALWDYPVPARSPAAPASLAGGILSLVPGRGSAEFEYIPYVWSLRVEIAFYLCAALAMAASTRDRRAVPAALAMATAASAVFLLRMRPGLLSTGPMFLAGIAWALWLRRPVPTRAGFVAIASALALAGFVSWRQHGTPAVPAQLVLVSLLLLLGALLSTARIAPRWHRLDRALGDACYPLYLNHYAVGILATDLLPARGPLPYGLSILAAIAASAVMGRAVDAPLRRLRDALRRTRL